MISSVILLTVCHTIVDVCLENLVLDLPISPYQCLSLFLSIACLILYWYYKEKFSLCHSWELSVTGKIFVSLGVNRFRIFTYYDLVLKFKLSKKTTSSILQKYHLNHTGALSVILIIIYLNSWNIFLSYMYVILMNIHDTIIRDLNKCLCTTMHKIQKNPVIS